MSNIRFDYEAAYRVLDRAYKATGIDEFAILLGAMDIDRSDDKPMDPLMWDYWEMAWQPGAAFDSFLRFINSYAAQLTPPPDDFAHIVSELNRNPLMIERFRRWFQEAEKERSG